MTWLYQPLPAGAAVGGVATFSGSGALTLPKPTASGAAKRALKSGAAQVDLPLVTAAGVAKRALSGVGAANLTLIAAAGEGTSAEDVYSGSGAATLPLVTSAGTGWWFSEAIYPNAVTLTNLTGAYTDIDESPDAPDGNWLQAA